MKKVIIALVAGLLSMGLVVTVLQARPIKRFDKRTQMCRFIADGQLGWDSEPWGAGGRKFREVCKSCHHRNNNKGAHFLYAESFVSSAWNRIFAERRVKCARDGSWNVLSEEDLAKVNDYLYRNADWTYNPNSADSCG